MSAPTQIERPFRVKFGSLEDDDLLLDSFEGQERVSEPFLFTLRVLSPNANLDIQSLLNEAVVLSIKLDGDKERHIHGNVSRISLVEAGADDMFAFQVEMRPAFWFLTQVQDCRAMLENSTVIDIVQKVLQESQIKFDNRTTGSYSPIDYCVQYRESNFNFVSRLLEQYGIFYFFEQTSDSHTLILADDTTAFKPCVNQPTVRYQLAAGGLLDENTVFTLEAEYRVKIGSTSLNDYDFTKPNTGLLSTLDGTQQGSVYDYPGKYSTKDEGDFYARIRLEEQETDIATVRGDSNCMGFECGYKVTLSEHSRDKANIDYTLLSLEHHARNTSYRAGQATPFSYQNRFEAIPNSVSFRPPRRARRPIIEGTQTAVVYGTSGDEIYSDQYGRIQVKFYWMKDPDRLYSCWIRVAQPWAGNQWGFICIPRVGQEVVVSYLEGDPDRPIITGSVYNALQMPPYTLPDNQTQSTWKSMSSKGGGGFNELRFEDNKGKEQIFIHGEKDLDMRIKNDRREWIGEDRHLVVVRDKLEKTGRDSHLDLSRDHIEKIGRDHHLTVSGKEAIAVTGSHTMKVTGDVVEQFSANHSSQVTQNLYLKALQVVIEASVGLTLKVGGSFVTLDASGVAIKGPMVQINSGGAALSGSAGSPVSPLSPTAATDASDAPPGAEGKAPKEASSPAAKISLTSVSPAGPSKTSAASDAPTHDPSDPANQDKTHFIEITLLDQEGSPVAGEPFKITLPDGSTVADGTTDDKGYARVDNIDPGNCQVTFPQLDKTVWKPS